MVREAHARVERICCLNWTWLLLAGILSVAD